MDNNQIIELKWGTPLIHYNDSTYGDIELHFRGRCNYIINNQNANKQYIEEHLLQELINAIRKIVYENQNDNYINLSHIDSNKIINEIKNYDFTIQSIYLESVNLSNSSKQKIEEQKKTQVKIVKTDVGAIDGQNKCPKCGATEISLNVNTGKLRCNYCRYEFENQKVENLQTDLSQLQGQVMGSGAQDIVASTNDIVTLKCSSCGAEVVIDTSEATQGRCHWCRSTLSINKQLPNGSVPDLVLPFGIKKDEAKKIIENFVGKRRFFAHPKFKSEFTTNNIMGVYFPYMLVDVNSHVNFTGEGEVQTKRYLVDDKTYYNADVYEVAREFDFVIEGLTVESNSDRLNNKQLDKTNNVINSIMPFDIENCVQWNSNYIKGFTSERRDINIDQLRVFVATQSKDIARHAANGTLSKYDRGVAWSDEQLQIIGQQWKSAYLPVWLYSYQQVKGNDKMLHYVAVNARTKEVMGSVPIHMPKLLLYSAFVEFFGVGGTVMAEFEYDWILSLSGFGFFILFYLKYRNTNARHRHEKDTKFKISNLKCVDRFIKKRERLSNSRITGVNNNQVNGTAVNGQVLENIANNFLKK